ncbi:MAG: T9SS type A sorting domain-containing protein [Ferruginibacter sp.]
MYWNCNNGTPRILVVGGGTSSNLNLGILTPPSTTITPLNLTGIGSVCQDMVDMVLDPTTNDIYTLFASLFVTPAINDKIYKNTAPYSAATIAWNVPSGFTVVQEAGNRPYMAPNIVTYDDNSANMLSLNASYLYYWDGKNLKAFDKTTGAGVGTSLVTANTAKMQGGIIADACDNIFVGEGNGVIKVYKFNGSTFDDLAAPDITIPGFNGKAVYDLAYDESRKLIYASGDGFVGSFDVSSYCPSTTYTVNVVPDCLTASATATVSPAPSSGSVITYTLFNGTTQLAVNTTGIFNGLSPNINYTIVATINLACSGTQATTSFTVPGPTVGVSHTNTTCGTSSGTITATGSGTAGPYTYSIDGTNFFASGTFTGLGAGVYTVTVKDAAGCKNSSVVVILNSNGPAVSFTQTNATCANNNGTIIANVTGGSAPYQYSINGISFQSNNFFTGLVGGIYTLTVKDAANCINVAVVTITSTPAPSVTAIPAAATCGSNNGTITAFGSGGTAPLEYSINGNVFLPGNVFINLVPGTYTVTVRDINQCISTTTVTIANSPAPSVTAGSTSALCNNVNGTITAFGSGGTAPLEYSINGVTFQPGNIFTGLAAGTYTVTVRDASGCTNIASVTVASVGGPTASATSTVSACNVNTGSITITGSGGLPGYQYSINGSTFQAGNTFNALGAGNYVAYVKDANGCIGTYSITVGNTAGPSINASGAPTSCNINDGIITITASGGTPGYQYSIDGATYGAGNIFTGLGAGNYTAYVKDANGCIKTANVTINNVSGLTLSVSTIVANCSANNGVITATATGGAAPLQYSINGTVYQASNVFNGLTAGNYTVYVKDANACIVTKPAVVSTVNPPSLTVTVQQQATCGTASGVIRATGSGGLAPLTYNIDGGAFQPVGIFINVAVGVHPIIVKDAAGCVSAPQSATITNSGAGAAPTDVTFNAVGFLSCIGEGRIKNIKGVPSGGGNNYTFSLDGAAFTTANQFRPVSIGTHTITAKNQNGCVITKLAAIGTGVPATATATSTATTCNGSTGTITINGVGANTPYHASIDGSSTWNTFSPPGANTFTFTGLSSGTHSITMADDADFITGPPDIPGACLTTIFVVVPSTGGPAISTSQINPTCNASNGNITAVGGGSAGPYTYNIDGGAYFPSGVFNNLAAGVHAVTVKDGAGCITGANVTLSNAAVPSVTASIQPASCNLNNGNITASATGGTPPLQYSINGTIFQSSNIFNNLAPGSYTLYVKDATQCYTTLPVIIANTSLPIATAFTIAASCNNNDGSIMAAGAGGTQPYTFSINGTVYQSSGTFSNLAAGFYTVYIKDARDCITTTGVSVANAGGPAITAAFSTPANCGSATGSITVTASGGGGGLEYSKDGINFQPMNVFNALLPGNYVITVRDVNGCLNTRAVTVADLLGPQTLTAVVIDAACGLNNGSIAASASGGTGLLQYSIDGTIYQVGNTFNGVPAGSYTLYVRDGNLCSKTLPVTVLNLAGPSLSATSSPASCGKSDGTITANASGGTTFLSYSKDGVTYQASNIFTGLAANTYLIRVKDARGCIDSLNVTVNTTNGFSGLLAATAGGLQVSTTATVAANGTTYLDTLCNLIARVVPSGASPVSGPISSKVIIDPSIQLYNNEPYVQRHFDIEPATNAATSTATITLYFRDLEFVDFNTNRGGFPALPTVANGGNADPNITNLRVTQYHGIPIFPHNAGNSAPGFYTNPTGLLIVPTSVNYNSTFNYWEVAIPVNGFSGFYVHTNLFFPLPITLNYFTGTKQGHDHLLNWKVTCNSTPSVSLILERSADAVNFNSIYNINATALRCNQPFDHTDANPLPGVNYYRLKMISADGKADYSNIVVLINNTKCFDIFSISPNPLTNVSFNLNLFSSSASPVEIKIMGMQGRVVDQQTRNITAGLNSISIHIDKLASGSYAIFASQQGNRSKVLKFAKE